MSLSSSSKMQGFAPEVRGIEKVISQAIEV